MNKKKKKLTAVFCMAVLIMSVLTVGISSSLDYSDEESETDEDILLVTIDENSDEDKLQGMEILHRYDDFALVRGDGNTVEQLENDGLRVNTLPSRTNIHVGGQEFDFTERKTDVSEDLTIEDYESGEKGLYIVHMLGPIASEWVNQIEDMDVDVMNYVHNYAYRVRMTPEQAEEVSELGFVDWVGVYHPEYKLQSDLEPGMVEIGLVSGAGYETVEQIGEIAGVDISINNEVSAESEANNEFESYKQSVLREKKEKENDENIPKFSYVELRNGESKVTIEVNSEEDLYEIARLNDVYYLNEHAGVELHDEMATQTIGGGLWFFDDGPEADGDWWEGDPWYPYRERGEYGSYMNQIDYTGDGVTIGVADTGIYADHDDFQDRVIGGHDFTPDDDPFLDGVGHGTHCTGSAAGDTYHGTGEILYPDVPEMLDYYLGQGSAPDAELFSAKIFDAAGTGHVPSPVTPIFTVANENGAYVHSNSWGSTAGHGEYTYSSPEFDAAVRDSNPDTDHNEPMVITGSAGNDGEMGTPPPATAKNVIVVGATQPFDPVLGNENPEYMAGFSSRGFTDDNRVKPDVVAPGNNIYSTMPDGGYGVMGGTSMSNPAVAGAAAVTVEWYEDTYGYTPSPAMVRSLLINTANPIDGDTRGPIPNEDEGWGMVDISKLQRPDPTSIYTVDQEDMFTTSGMVHDYEIEHEDPEEPLKVTLGWTDKEAPVDTGSDPALLNDLNLEIESPGGHIYRGNALEDGWSQSNEDAMETFDRTGDGWDDTNNVENVYIPADEVEEGIYTVKVEGRNIVEDAIGIGGPSQDFALTAYNAQEGEIVDEPPTVELDRPEGGDVWQARTEEDIEWTATPGDNDLDRVNIFYSDDGWVTQNLIADGLDPDVGSYTWTLPNIDSTEVQVRAVVVDVEGNSGEEYSGDFTIEGIPPEPPENLLVEYDNISVEEVFYDDVEGGDLGYTTGSTGATNLWDIRDHGSTSGVNSWDWGDAGYEKVGEHSWLTSPEMNIPADAVSAELTFQHWRDIADTWDGVNIKVSTDGTNWELIEDPDPGYDYEIETGWGNPIEGQPAWGGSVGWEEVTVDLSEYSGETIYLRWDAGVESFTGGAEGWRIDDIEVTADVQQADPVSNRLRWYSSPDEEIDEVSHYNIYRNDSSDMDEAEHIATIDADGSEKYSYLDYGTAGDPWNWYVVRAVGTNELEEDNEDSKPEPGAPGVKPEIAIDVPNSGTTWNAYDEELIEWTTTEGDEAIDYIDYLEYSDDGGNTWTQIDEILEDTGEYDWTVPNWPSEEAMIRARVVDEDGHWNESTSEEFEIVGESPDPAENLDVQHVDATEDWHWMYPDDHRADVDNGIGLTGPGVWYGAIRTELPEGELTDLAYYDLQEANYVKGQVYTDGGDQPGDLIAETGEVTDLGNDEWLEIPIDGTVNIDEGTYWIVLEIDDIGDGYSPFGTIDPYVEDGGWLSLDGDSWEHTADYGLDATWTLEAHVKEFDETGNNDNMITWESSPHDPFDDPKEVTHYNIYRAETDWESPVLIDTVEAEGLEEYQYFDYDAGMPDDTFWWYNVTAVARNGMETDHVEAVQEPIPPEITITSPTAGDEWEFGDTETITWDTTAHDHDIHEVDLFYSLDGGATIHDQIAEGIDYAEGEYDWEIPDVYSEEAHIIGRVYDVEGNWRDNASEEFTIIGEPPLPPENPLVEHYGTQTIFYDDVSSDLGYTTGSSGGENTWDIRDHDAFVGTQSWDWGDAGYDKAGEVSWLISPEIDIPVDAVSAELTFQHWRDIADTWDGVNIKVSTDGTNWELIEDPDPGYDHVIGTGFGNPIEGQPAWGGSVGWEEVTVDLSDYAGETIYLRWDAGVEDWYGGAEGWRIDNITVTGDMPLENGDDNFVRWHASPDEELGEIDHYNIYRNETRDMDEADHIATIDADGSDTYDYMDEGRGEADGTYWWYVVRAVDEFGQEEMNEDAVQEPGDAVEEPDITIDQPDAGTTWNAYDEEFIQWTTTEGDRPIDYIDRLWYSIDGGANWMEIDEILDDDGEEAWNVTNWPTENAMIRARVVDDYGRWYENTSEEFEIVGEGPEAPQTLEVDHGAPQEWNWMYPDDHRADPYNALGLNAEQTWQTAIRVELPEGEATEIAFHDWGEAISFTGSIHEDEGTEPGEMIGTTETVAGLTEPQWREIPLVEPVELEGGHYWIVVDIHDPGDGYFPASMIAGYEDDAGWFTYEGQPWMTLDDIGYDDDSWTIEVFVEEYGNEDNVITWEGSADDPADGRPEEISHYEIYRSETDWGPETHIETIEADGSDTYRYLDEDRGMADDTYWWYNITGVAHNGMETDLDFAVQEPIPPDINITSPIAGDEWEYGNTETITWETTEHDHEITEVDLYYSLDDGATKYDQIAEGIDYAEGEYDWEIPDVYSEEARIVADIYDVEGYYRTNESEQFTIIGTPPEAPQNLIIEHDGADNLVQWQASPDEELGEISHYNIYRSEDREGPWNGTTLIDSINADGSEEYEYIDAGEAGDPYQWYVVRAVDEFGQEEMNEDAKLEPGDPEYNEPWISIDSPEAGDVWYNATTQEIIFYHGAGYVDQDIDYVNLYGRTDPGEDWNIIGEGLEPDLYDDQPYTYEVELNVTDNTDQAQIRAVIVDDIGYSDEDITGEFSIYEDDTAPDLEITAPEEGALLSDDIVTVEWNASDDESSIDYFEIRHTDDEEWTELDGETYSYEFPDLADGENTIEVRAHDIAGNNVTESVTFTLDTTQPEVIITSPDHGDIIADDDVTVQWSGYDETTEIVSYDVQINGEGWQNVDMRTWHEFDGLAEGQHTVDVMAEDEAGNQYTDTIDFYLVESQALFDITTPENGVESLTFEENFTIEGQSPTWLNIYINGVDVGSGDFEYSTTLEEGLNVFNVQAVHNPVVYEENVYALYLPDIPELWDEIATVEEDLQTQIDDLQTQIDDLETDMDELETDLQNQIDDLQTELNDLETNLQNQIDDLQNQIDDLQTQIDDLQTDMDELETDLQDQIDDLQTQIDDLETNLQGQIDDLQTELNDFEDEQEDVDNDQDDDISMARNLGIVGMIIAILALIIGIFAMSKGGKTTEEPYGEEESFEDEQFGEEESFEDEQFGEEESFEEEPFDDEELEEEDLFSEDEELEEDF